MGQSISMEDLLQTDAVWADVEAPTKKQLLQDMSHQAADVLSMDENGIFDVLWEREQLGTTGVGQGIAIPHGRVSGLKDVRGFFARLREPVTFDAEDNRPVDLVFLLLAPDTAGADHLHALATVSRVLRNEEICEKLRHAPDAAAMRKIIAAAQALPAA